MNKTREKLTAVHFGIVAAAMVIPLLVVALIEIVRKLAHVLL